MPLIRNSIRDLQMADITFLSTSYEKSKYDFIAFRNANREIIQSETYFDWRYLTRPCKQLKPIIVWAETVQGRKVGSLSVVPDYYMINNRLCPIGVLGDISVSRECRGQGIAQKMFHYLSGLGEMNDYDACIVLPNEDAARPLQKAKWQTVSRLERYVKILDLEHQFKRLLKLSVLSKVISLPLNHALKLIYLETYLRPSSEYSGEFAADFDERFDELWNNINKTDIIIGLRNSEYLRWRYSKHPLLKYRIFTLLRHDKLCGYIVFYSEKDKLFIEDMASLRGNDYGTCLLYHFLIVAKQEERLSSITLKMDRNNLSGFPLSLFGFIKRSNNKKLMIKQNVNTVETSSLFDGHKWYLTHRDKEV